jgi:hypothetical protein
MILITHIALALASVAYATFVLLSPTRARLRISYTLVASTLISGTYLVISTHAPMLQSCMSGLLYTGFVSLGLAVGHRKLVASEATAKNK